MKIEPKSSQQASVLLRTGLARPHPVLLTGKKLPRKGRRIKRGQNLFETVLKNLFETVLKKRREGE